MQNSKKAITSLVCGILGLTCIPAICSIIAIITGHMAKGDIKKSGGTVGGDGVATAGVITGYIGIAYAIFIIPMMLAIAIPGFMNARRTAQTNATVYNLELLANATFDYAHGNDGYLPEELSDLDMFFEGEVPLVSMFDKEGPGYVLLIPGENWIELADPATTPMIKDASAEKFGITLLVYADGSIVSREAELPEAEEPR